MMSARAASVISLATLALGAPVKREGPYERALTQGGSSYFTLTSGPCVITDNGECVTSDNYPTQYGNDVTCTITATSSIHVAFTHFDVENHYTCDYDYIEVGGSKYCGKTSGDTNYPPPSLQVGANTVITFKSDSFQAETGWKMCKHTPPVYTVVAVSGDGCTKVTGTDCVQSDG